MIEIAMRSFRHMHVVGDHDPGVAMAVVGTKARFLKQGGVVEIAGQKAIECQSCGALVFWEDSYHAPMGWRCVHCFDREERGRVGCAR